VSAGRRRRDAATYETVYLPIEDILATEPLVRSMLRGGGVAARDEDDLVQEVMSGAWQAMTEGRFRIERHADPRRALGRWMVGIAGHHVGHYHERAYLRYEVLRSDLADLAGSYTIGGRLGARSALSLLALVEPKYRRALVLRAAGYLLREVGAIEGVTLHSAKTRVLLGKRDLARALGVIFPRPQRRKPVKLRGRRRS
jgi:RNA polymerase sigma-70 factor (ECF subfamily)